MAVFDDWAEFYDLVHEGLPGEAEFYVGHAVRTGGKALEIGCGTGRIAIPMAMMGLDVTGVDNSEAMLARCRAKKRAIGRTNGKLTLVCADMRSFDLGCQFDFVAMAYRTFMHALTPQDQIRCLRTIRKHMKDDGLFVMNTWRPARKLLQSLADVSPRSPLKEIERYPLSHAGQTVVHYHAVRCNMPWQLLIERHRLDVVDHAGQVINQIRLPMTRRWSTVEEIRRLIEQAGLRVEALFGDFECNPCRGHATEMVWIIRKK